MAHVIIPEAEEILDKEFPVLDKGFIRLIDYNGGDARVVQAARVSYGAGTKTVREDEVLIRYLLSHKHTSPFEMVDFTWHCKMPIFVARQWVRHRTASLNEISGRYSVMRDEFYVPAFDQIKGQSKDNKQGREIENLPKEVGEEIRTQYEAGQRNSYDFYQHLVEKKGLAKELARINLPLSLYTEWYWKNDLHNTLHILKLRMDAHAQYEIRVYAEKMGEILKTVVPHTWKAFLCVHIC